MNDRPNPFTKLGSSPPASNNLATQSDESREFLFTDQDFERIRKLIYDRAGIALSPIKRDMVYSRLARRLRATGIHTFGEYLCLLEQSGATELEEFTNSLTTNLTFFFAKSITFHCCKSFSNHACIKATSIFGVRHHPPARSPIRSP